MTKHSTTEIQNKTRELTSLRNKLRRYWKKLLEEAVKVAQTEGRQSEIVDLEHISSRVFLDSSTTIPLYKDGEDIDVDILLKLAQPGNPALYRKYIQGKNRYEKEINDLGKMLS